MDIKETIQFLLIDGYEHIRVIPGKGICGIRRMAYTTGLFYGMDQDSYFGRYCFHSWSEALDAIEEWDGNGDAPGNWIKRKGVGGDYRNPNYVEDDSFIY